MVLQYLVLMILAYLSTSQMVENDSRSTYDLREHKFSVSNLGNMSVLRSTKYTVVQRFLAYMSRAESGLT